VGAFGQRLIAERRVGLQAVEQFEVCLVYGDLFHEYIVNEIKFNQQV
jgi:hypothetical protein